MREGVQNRETYIYKISFRDGQDILSHSMHFYDKNYSMNRVVTDMDWSPQLNELFLTSYSQNEEGSIKDHVGVILTWSLALRSRP